MFYVDVSKKIKMDTGAVMLEKKNAGIVMLFSAAFIWGFSYIVQYRGMDNIGPYTFSGLRGLIASAASFILLLVIRKRNAASGPLFDSRSIKAGMILGILQALASNLQQVAFLYTDVAKVGFITSLYVIFVPIIGIFMGRKISFKLAACILAATVGLYFISVQPGTFYVAKGDILAAGCAFFFACHIIVIDIMAKDADISAVNVIQFFIFGVVSLVPAFFREQISISGISQATLPLLYAGVFGGCIAFAFQMYAQKQVPPAMTTLCLCPEPIFGALLGWLILGQKLSVREIAGCAIVFAAVLAAQLIPSGYPGEPAA